MRKKNKMLILVFLRFLNYGYFCNSLPERSDKRIIKINLIFEVGSGNRRPRDSRPTNYNLIRNAYFWT